MLWRATKLTTLIFILLAFSVLMLFVFSPSPLLSVTTWPVSPVLLDKNGYLIHARLSVDQEWCLPIPLEDMSEWLPKILVQVEDKRFFSHSGIDIFALTRATLQNIQAGRVVSGASTISSQLVRLSNPRPRTLATKFLEFAGAVKIEQKLTKNEILEIYLNRAPFGGNIRGVEAAARMYFGKRAKELSLGEASLLIGLLKGPTAYRPDRNPKASLKRRQSIIQQIAISKDFPADLTALALEEPLPKFSPVMPAGAWHFADLAFQSLPMLEGKNLGGTVRSTLDSKIQAMLETTLMSKLAGESSELTAAAVVVDNQTASIVAYVGNARFNMANNKEWVDCARAPRSPGSTLKPFVYLTAMESGKIIPASLLADTPLRLGGEAPRNFDKNYRGPITAERALVDSINVPAVRVLRMVGLRTMMNRFQFAGFTMLERIDAAHGDSLVLGAGEVTLLELARAYATMANLGYDQPLAVRQEQISTVQEQGTLGNDVALERFRGSNLHGLVLPSEKETKTLKERKTKRLYSEAASFLIAEMLKDTTRLPLISQFVQAREQAPVAFKTGTSYGLRDAWVAAYNPRYTTVVWFGRADGKTSQRLVGLSLAAPVGLEVLRNLQNTGNSQTLWESGVQVDNSWYAKPNGVAKHNVCSISGAEPSAFCLNTKAAWYIPAVWRTLPCSLHQLKDGKIQLVWPPELEDFQQKRMASQDLSRELLIVSPRPNAKYLLLPEAPQQTVALKVEGASYPLHWYNNGLYLGEQTSPDLPIFLDLSEGEQRISVLDAKSKTAIRVLQVESLKNIAQDIPLLGE